MCLQLMLHGVPDGIAGLAVLQLRQALHLTRIVCVLLQRLLRPLRQRLQSQKTASQSHATAEVCRRGQSTGLPQSRALLLKDFPLW